MELNHKKVKILNNELNGYISLDPSFTCDLKSNSSDNFQDIVTNDLYKKNQEIKESTQHTCSNSKNSEQNQPDSFTGFVNLRGDKSRQNKFTSYRNGRTPLNREVHCHLQAQVDILEERVKSTENLLSRNNFFIGLLLANSTFPNDSVRMEVAEYQTNNYTNEEKTMINTYLRNTEESQIIQGLDEIDLDTTIQISEKHTNISLKRDSTKSQIDMNPISLKKYFSQPGTSVLKKHGKKWPSSLLHFAQIYSNPFIEITENVVDEKSNKNTGKHRTYKSKPTFAVDFVKEVKSIKTVLEYPRKKVSLHLECSHFDNFINVVKKRPRILHIMCHGSFDSKTKEFYLEFENSKTEVLKLTPDLLRESLEGEDLSDIKIIFQNACHSQHIAPEFLKLGVGCVIVVKGQLKINEDIAQEFSATFYRQLLSGKSIQQSWDESQRNMQVNHHNEMYTCCCGHEHTIDCNWYQLALEKGIEYAHHMHEATCSCPNSKKHLHLFDCKWALGFENEFEPEQLTPEMVVIGNRYIDEGRLICCCNPTLPHNENLKYELMFKDDDESYGDQVVFGDLGKGSVQLVNRNNFSYTKFFACKSLGQDTLIYDMFCSLVDPNKKVILLWGKIGMGKTTVVKVLANNLYERDKFKKIHYIDLEFTNTTLELQSKLFNDFHIKSQQNLKDKANDDTTLVIQNHIQKTIDNDLDELQKFFSDLVEGSYIKWVLVGEEKCQILNNFRLSYEVNYPIKPLSVEFGAKMLKFQAYEKLENDYKNIIELQQHPQLADKKGITPNYISKIASLVNKGHTLKDIKKEMANKFSNIDQASLQDISNGFQQLYNLTDPEYLGCSKPEKKFLEDLRAFLGMICFFPAGLQKRDLIFMDEEGGYIPQNWIDLLYIVCCLKEFTIREIINVKNRNQNYCEDGKLTFCQKVEIFERESLKEGYLLNIGYITIGGHSEFIIRPNDVLYNYVKHDEEIVVYETLLYKEFSENMTKVIQYETLLLREMLSQIRLKGYAWECSIENSNQSSCLVWRLKFGGCSKAVYFSAEIGNEQDLIQIYEFHYKNIFFLITNEHNFKISAIYEYAKTPSPPPANFIDIIRNQSIIEDFLTQALTINKIYLPFESCLVVIGYIKSIVTIQKPSNDGLNKLLPKVLQHSASLYVLKMDSSYQNEKLTKELNEILNHLNLVVGRLIDFEWLTYKIMFIMICNHHKRKDGSFLRQDIGELYTLTETLKDGQNEEDWKVLWSKSTYFRVKMKYKTTTHSMGDIDLLKRCAELFFGFGIVNLYAKCQILLGNAYKNNTDKCTNYFEQAIQTCQRIGYKKLAEKAEFLTNKIRKDRKQKFKNKLVFLKAEGLNIGVAGDGKKKQVESSSLSIKPDLRSNLLEKLNIINKSIDIKFDILNQKTIEEYFCNKGGCKLLVLQIDEEIPFENIVYEKDNQILDKMSFDELREIITGNLHDNDHTYKYESTYDENGTTYNDNNHSNRSLCLNGLWRTQTNIEEFKQNIDECEIQSVISICNQPSLGHFKSNDQFAEISEIPGCSTNWFNSENLDFSTNKKQKAIGHVNSVYSQSTNLLKNSAGGDAIDDIDQKSTRSLTNTFLPNQSYSKPKKLNIDVMCIINQNGKNLASFFKELGVSYVLYFNLRSEETNNIDILNKWIEVRFMELVLLKFCEQIAKGVDICHSFNNAKNEAAEVIKDELLTEFKIYKTTCKSSSKKDSQKLETQDIVNFLQSKLDSAAVLLLSAKSDCLEIEKSTQLIINNGKVSDKTLYPPLESHRPLIKKCFIQIKRNKEQHEISKKLDQSILQNVFGEEGTGKTELIEEFVQISKERLKYPDGVYYFNLETLYKKRRPKFSEPISLKELLQPTFKEEFSKNMSEFFRGKKMLIIFDNFEICYKDQKVKHSKIFFESILKGSVKLVWVSKEKIDEEKFDVIEVQHDYDYHMVQKQSHEQSVLAMLISLNKIFVMFPNYSKQIFGEVARLKKISGVLGKLVDKKVVQEFVMKELEINESKNDFDNEVEGEKKNCEGDKKPKKKKKKKKVKIVAG